ncbi:hypothetical protein [Salidesulfovibrio onnuriiensis]|uniref:hypothetical protein n=1 Tax=Salidesulfovibrio onnuriiensis TaxID=2583823 RepID=UPI0011CA638E|nr:hypothetical protein [Salidesulfovibrio onnuriiensis]
MNTARQKTKTIHIIRNIALVVIALGGVAFFFTLDLFEDNGEGGLFGPKMSSKLHFVGQVKSTEFSNEQLKQISSFIGKYEEALERVEISVSKDDSYAELKPGTQVLFEIHIRLVGGARLETPVRRTTWGQLIPMATRKIDKDLKAYAAMHGGKLRTSGGNVLINSM